MAIDMPKLPFEIDALQPHMSETTLSYHFGKHHTGYAKKVNKAVEGTDYENLSLEDIISRARERADIGLLNNAAQTWNHSFFWDSLTPDKSKPSQALTDRLLASFGSMAAFKSEFRSAAAGLFGSGWVWLVQDGDALRIITTGNADSPVGTAMKPLLTLDVWEHAYYLDHQNDRGRFIDVFLDHLVNWEFASRNLEENGIDKAA